ncbi:MAG: DUF1326 domain-containing protein [Hyphomonadaceae bacterium]|nr:DUF1326 domain-containing protein [Hyphomonadaceae bacterium]
MTDWSIQGREFTNCNCAYGCPCQFNALPTHGDCQATVAVQIDKGHHGDTSLDGLRFAGVFRWPGPSHMGGGEALAIVDERATPAQRDALLRIITGQDTEPGATIFQVFSTTFDKLHDPVFAPIEFDVDIDKRSAKLRVPNVVEARGAPIVNPVTGAEHRARINLDQGFEYLTAEVARGWTETKGAIELAFADSHAHFCELRLTQSGIQA